MDGTGILATSTCPYELHTCTGIVLLQGYHEATTRLLTAATRPSSTAAAARLIPAALPTPLIPAARSRHRWPAHREKDLDEAVLQAAVRCLSQPMKPSFPVISLIESSWSSGITAARSRAIHWSGRGGRFEPQRGFRPKKGSASRKRPEKERAVGGSEVSKSS